MPPRDYTPVTTIDLSLDRTAVIEVFPWTRLEDRGWSPWNPELVVSTTAGELRFTYNVERRRFSVSAKEVRYKGMPAGLTLQAHRDEASYLGREIEMLSNLDRVPTWNCSGYERRSDERAVTRTMSNAHDMHVAAVTERCAKQGMLRRLAEVTQAWEARKRLAVVEAEIAALADERAELARSIANDSLPF